MRISLLALGLQQIANLTVPELELTITRHLIRLTHYLVKVLHQVLRLNKKLYLLNQFLVKSSFTLLHERVQLFVFLICVLNLDINLKLDPLWNFNKKEGLVREFHFRTLDCLDEKLIYVRRS